LEDGEPLTHSGFHADIEKSPGLYSHWGDAVIFSPRAGPPDRSAYSIRYPRLPSWARPLRWLSAACPWAAFACLLALALALWRRPAAGGWTGALLLAGL